MTVNKRRQIFSYEGFELVIDQIKQLGYFLEIEAKDVAGSVREKKEKCFQLLEQLGLEWQQAPEQGYPDMILDQEP